MLELARQGLRIKSISKVRIAEELGLGKPWVTKFFDGSLKTAKEETLFQLEDLLGVKFFSLDKPPGDRSPLADKIANRVDADPTFAKLAVTLEEALTEAQKSITPRFIPTKEMNQVGREIIQIVEQFKDKPGKVTREVLRILA